MGERPKCRRCGGPLDLWHDEAGWQLRCEPEMRQSDDRAFWAAWEQLPGDDVVRLLGQIGAVRGGEEVHHGDA